MKRRGMAFHVNGDIGRFCNFIREDLRAAFQVRAILFPVIGYIVNLISHLEQVESLTLHAVVCSQRSIAQFKPNSEMISDSRKQITSL